MHGMHWIYDALKDRIVMSTIAFNSFNNFIDCLFSVKFIERAISSIMHHSVHIDPFNLPLPQSTSPLTERQPDSLRNPRSDIIHAQGQPGRRIIEVDSGPACYNKRTRWNSLNIAT